MLSRYTSEKRLETHMRTTRVRFRMAAQRPSAVLVAGASWMLLLLLVLSACTGPGSSNNPSSNQPTQPGRAVQTPPGPPVQCASHSTNPVTLTMYYSSEKQQWIDAAVTDFNSHNFAACDGPIAIE